jgi:hypothetical protein
VLADVSAPVEERWDAAKTLRPYYHSRLARMGGLLKEFGE